MLPDSFKLSDLYCGHEGKYICSLKGRFDPQLVNEPIQLMELSCGCWIVLDGNNRIGLILKRNMDAMIGEFPRKIFLFKKNEEFDEIEIHYWNPYPKSFGYVIPLSKQLNIVTRNKKSFKSETDYNNEVNRITSSLTNQMHECHPHATKNGALSLGSGLAFTHYRPACRFES